MICFSILFMFIFGCLHLGLFVFTSILRFDGYTTLPSRKVHDRVAVLRVCIIISSCRLTPSSRDFFGGSSKLLEFLLQECGGIIPFTTFCQHFVLDRCPFLVFKSPLDRSLDA